MERVNFSGVLSLEGMLIHSRARVVPPQTAALVLSDDYTPVEFIGNWLMEKSRQYVIEHTGVEILL